MAHSRDSGILECPNPSGEAMALREKEKIEREQDISDLADYAFNDAVTHLTPENAGQYRDCIWIGWSLVTREALCGDSEYDRVNAFLRERHGNDEHTSRYTITGPYLKFSEAELTQVAREARDLID